MAMTREACLQGDLCYHCFQSGLVETPDYKSRCTPTHTQTWPLPIRVPRLLQVPTNAILRTRVRLATCNTNYCTKPWAMLTTGVFRNVARSVMTGYCGSRGFSHISLINIHMTWGRVGGITGGSRNKVGRGVNNGLKSEPDGGEQKSGPIQPRRTRTWTPICHRRLSRSRRMSWSRRARASWHRATLAMERHGLIANGRASLHRDRRTGMDTDTDTNTCQGPGPRVQPLPLPRLQ